MLSGGEALILQASSLQAPELGPYNLALNPCRRRSQGETKIQNCRFDPGTLRVQAVA